MSALFLVFTLGSLLVLAAFFERPERRRATTDELVSARAIAAARLQEIGEAREERFRQYHRAWSSARPKAGPRPYVLPFAAGGRER